MKEFILGNKFKVGDKVICIDEDGGNFLHKGKEYVVAKIENSYVWVYNINNFKIVRGGFFPIRFKFTLKKKYVLKFTMEELRKIKIKCGVRISNKINKFLEGVE